MLLSLSLSLSLFVLRRHSERIEESPHFALRRCLFLPLSLPLPLNRHEKPSKKPCQAPKPPNYLKIKDIRVA
jgi:hypothetical protein